MNESPTQRPADQPEPVDFALLSDLRRVIAAVDPPPQDLQLLAREAFSVRRIDAELAELVADSREQVGAVRSATAVGAEPTDRLLSFEVDGIAIEVQFSRRDDGPGPAGEERWRIVGVVDGLDEVADQAGRPDRPGPADRLRVDIEDGRAQAASAHVDEFGRFVLDDARGGPVRLRIRFGAGVDITTDWVVISRG